MSLVKKLAEFHRHIIIAAVTGNGKTTVLQNAIAQINEKSPDSTFLIASGKPSPWLGLEQQYGEDGRARCINVFMEALETIEPLLERLEWVTQEQSRRAKARMIAHIQGTEYIEPEPIYMIIDELPTIVDVAKASNPKNSARLNRLIKAIINTGREDKVFAWLISQGHQCNSLDFSKDVRRNLGFVCLGGGSSKDYTTIIAAIADSHFIENDNLRKDLELEYKAYTSDCDGIRIYLSNIGGYKIDEVEALSTPDQIFKGDPNFNLDDLFAPTQEQKPKRNKEARKVKVGETSSDGEKALQEENDKGTKGNSNRTQKSLRRRKRKKIEEEEQNQSEEQVSSPPSRKRGRKDAVQEKEIEIKENEFQLKVIDFAVKNYQKENFWNLLVTSYGLLFTACYLIPPLSSFTQGSVKLAQQTVTKAEQASKRINEFTANTKELFSPNYRRPAHKGEKVAGYPVTSVFGMRQHPLTGHVRPHNGTDLGTPVGTNLYVAANSNQKVNVICKLSPGAGLNAEYKIGTTKVRLFHLSKCQPGETTGGRVIAQSGGARGAEGSGTSTGPHLHLEVHENNTPINPPVGYLWATITGNVK